MLTSLFLFPVLLAQEHTSVLVVMTLARICDDLELCKLLKCNITFIGISVDCMHFNIYTRWRLEIMSTVYLNMKNEIPSFKMKLTDG